MTTDQTIKLSKGIAELGLGIGGLILAMGGTIGSGGGAVAVVTPLAIASAGSIALGAADVLDVLRNVQISQSSGGTGNKNSYLSNKEANEAKKKMLELINCGKR